MEMETRIIKTAPLAISPQKMNLAAGLIRRRSLDQALKNLSFSPHKGGVILYKLLQGIVKSLTHEKQAIKKLEKELQSLTDGKKGLISDFIQVRKKMKEDKTDKNARKEARKLEEQLEKKGLSNEKIEKIIQYGERLVKVGQQIKVEQPREISDFYLSRIEVNQGPTLKRAIYRAKGRTDRIRKRRSVIKLHLSTKENLKYNI